MQICSVSALSGKAPMEDRVLTQSKIFKYGHPVFLGVGFKRLTNMTFVTDMSFRQTLKTVGVWVTDRHRFNTRMTGPEAWRSERNSAISNGTQKRTCKSKPSATNLILILNLN